MSKFGREPTGHDGTHWAICRSNSLRHQSAVNVLSFGRSRAISWVASAVTLHHCFSNTKISLDIHVFESMLPMIVHRGLRQRPMIWRSPTSYSIMYNVVARVSFAGMLTIHVHRDSHISSTME